MRTPERKQLGLTKCHNMMMKNAEQTTSRSSSFFRRTSHRNSSERFKAVTRPFQRKTRILMLLFCNNCLSCRPTIVYKRLSLKQLVQLQTPKVPLAVFGYSSMA